MTDYSINIHALARDAGIAIEDCPFEHMDGIVVRLRQRAFVGLRKTADIRTKRYALAHEMGHVRDGTATSRYCLLAERRADRLARASVIPEGWLRRAIEDGHTEYSVLASLFGVSEEVVEQRCKEVFNS